MNNLIQKLIVLVCIGLLCSPSLSAAVTTDDGFPVMTVTVGANGDVITTAARGSNAGTITSLIIVLAPGVTNYSIDDGAFISCNALESVVLPEGLTTIGDIAFNNCFALQSLIIPASVISIGGLAFNNSGNLASVTFKGSDPSLITIDMDFMGTGDGAFNNAGSLVGGCTYYLPSGANALAWAMKFPFMVSGDSSLEVLPAPPEPPTEPERNPGDVHIGGDVRVGKGSTLNIGKP